MNEAYAKMTVQDYSTSPGIGMVKVGDIQQLFDRIVNNTSNIRELSYEVATIADRVYGSRPAEAVAVGKVEEPNGMISAVYAALVAQEDTIQYLRSQVRRLQEL